MADKVIPSDAKPAADAGAPAAGANATSNATANATATPGAAAPAIRRGPGHRGADVRDTVAEMAAKAHEISQEAGSKIAAAMKDVINAAAGLAGFAVESARDLVQYMVRRGQMTQEEADKLMREAEEAHIKRGGTRITSPAPRFDAPSPEARRTPAPSVATIAPATPLPAPPSLPAKRPVPAAVPRPAEKPAPKPAAKRAHKPAAKSPKSAKSARSAAKPAGKANKSAKKATTARASSKPAKKKR